MVRKLAVRILASLSHEHLRATRHPLLAKVVQVLPPLPFSGCLEEQQRADACLLVLEDSPGSEIMVSQKIFEYLAAQKPVFALIPPGAAAEILASTGGAAVSIRESPAKCARRLARFLEQVRSGSFQTISPETLAPFERTRQTAGIATLLDDLAAP